MTSARTTAPQSPKLEVKLRSRQALKDAMTFNRVTIRDLSLACGNMRYRSTIGHLHSGARTTCSPHLARRIEESLRLYPNALFELRMTTVISDTTPKRRASDVQSPTRAGRRTAVHDAAGSR